MKPIEALKKWYKECDEPKQVGISVEHGIPKWLLERYPCKNGLVQSMCIIYTNQEPVRVYVDYIPKDYK